MLSPLSYAAADALAGLLRPGYSFRDQVISELGAIGAPSRPLFSVLLLGVYLMLVAFGAGVWQAAGGRARLRTVGALLVGLGVLALAVGQFVPMQPRGTEQGLAGGLHLAEGAVAMLVVMAAMIVAAGAFGRGFLLYTVATIAVVLAFGAWSASDAPRIEAGLATPWAGVRERVSGTRTSRGSRCWRSGCCAKPAKPLPALLPMRHTVGSTPVQPAMQRAMPVTAELGDRTGAPHPRDGAASRRRGRRCTPACRSTKHRCGAGAVAPRDDRPRAAAAAAEERRCPGFRRTR